MEENIYVHVCMYEPNRVKTECIGMRASERKNVEEEQ